MIDLIPLHEIDACKPLKSEDKLGETEALDSDGVNAFQIETSPDGYNSGTLK